MRMAAKNTHAGYGQITPLGGDWGAPATGKYKGPGGYVYGYYAPTGAIKVLVSPSGGSWAVAEGTSAYKAILGQIESGEASPITTQEYTALKASSAASTSASTSEPSTTEVPITSRAWFLPVVASVGLLGVAAVGVAVSKQPRRNPKRGRRKKRGGIPWWVLGGVTLLAAGDIVTPGFPFPGSALIMVPLAGAAWVAKLDEYGVQR